MKVAVFDSHNFDKTALEDANARYKHSLVFIEPRLTRETVVLAQGHDAICIFVNDRADSATIEILARHGVRLIALRCAGFNNVDLVAAEAAHMRVVRVPEYSPFAVAEHTFALLLSLVRRLPRALARVREANFSLDGLVGFDLHGRTMGVLGTGKIGIAVVKIARGFGMRVLAFDAAPNTLAAKELGFEYVGLDEIYRTADVITLHLPLTPQTHHLIDGPALSQMRPHVILLNTGRGALVDTPAMIGALKRGAIGGAALDVYEEEAGLFFRDLSDKILQDDVLARLLTFPNVLITAHQAFLTQEALANIADTTLQSISAFEQGGVLKQEVRSANVLA